MYEKMYETQKESHPTRIITDKSKTAVENFSTFFVRKSLLSVIFKIDTTIQGKKQMLKTTDDLNKNENLHGNCLSIFFDVVSMLPNTNNKRRIESVKNVLTKKDENISPTERVIQELELLLSCNGDFSIPTAW